MTLALADAGVRPGDIAHVNAHGTSTVLNDRAEAAALRTVFGDSCPPVMAVKGSTGHMVGGSGAVEAIVSLISLRDRVVGQHIGLDVVRDAPRPAGPGYALSNSFGFGGANTSLVLAAGGSAG